MAFIQLATGLFLYFKPLIFFQTLNAGPRIYAQLQAITEPTEKFTLVLAAAFFLTQAAISIGMGLKPKAKSFALFQVVASASSIAGFLTLYLHDAPLFAYQLGAGFQALVLVWTLFHFVRMPFRV